MKVTRSFGPFTERPFYSETEIESIATDELRNVDLLPSSPEPIRIERFIEKRFGITPVYEELPQGVLGFTQFGSSGVEEVVVSRALSEEGSAVAERRVNTTLAHEAGHGLLHTHLFVLGGYNHALFDDDDVSPGKVLCRDVPHQAGTARRGYDGRWWELQANMLMGALLLPKTLVLECVQQLLEPRGKLGMLVLPTGRREPAARLLSETFDVNPVVGRIRLGSILRDDQDNQLLL